MATYLQLYKCVACGNVIEILHAGPGPITCCGQPMQALVENSVDASKEKHLPVCEQADGNLGVKVGSIPHPMEEAHYIEWIEVICGGKIYRQHLTPGSSPKAVFAISGEGMTVRAYCNLHGQWSSAV